MTGGLSVIFGGGRRVEGRRSKLELRRNIVRDRTPRTHFVLSIERVVNPFDGGQIFFLKVCAIGRSDSGS